MQGAALIIATRETGAEDGDAARGTLVATLPLLGQTLIEHQVRQAAAVGARHIVLLVERLPAALLAAVDALRRDGIAVEIARAVTDAADRFHPAEPVLLIGDGAVLPSALLARIVAAGLPAIAVRADDAGFDRIDAAHWWAGAALLDGAGIRATVAMLGDWDAEPTLVRRAVQAGAVRIEAVPGMLPLRIAEAAAIPAVQAGLAAGADGLWAEVVPPGWPAHHLHDPVARLFGRWLAPFPIEAGWLTMGAGLLGILGGIAALAGWAGTGFGLFLASALPAAAARRLAGLRFRRLRHAGRWEMLRQAGGALLLLGAARLTGTATWPVVASGAILALLAGQREKAMLRRTGSIAPGWAADTDGLALALLPGLAIAGWPGGVAAAALYAAMSFAGVQRQLARHILV